MIRAIWRVRKPKKEEVDTSAERLLEVPKDLRAVVSDAKLAALQSRFDQFDVDHSGFIDSTELTDLLRALGFNPPQHRVECIIDEYDTDHNGNLSFGEFVEVWAMYCMEAETECKMIRKAFSFFDFDDSMSLSYSEVRAILTQTGEPLQRDEVIEFLQIVDEDQDGMLHIEELMKVVYANAQSGDGSLTQLFDDDVDDDTRAHVESRGLPQAQARTTVLGLLGRGLEFGKSFTLQTALSRPGKVAVGRPAAGSGAAAAPQEAAGTEGASGALTGAGSVEPPSPTHARRAIRFGLLDSLRRWSSIAPRPEPHAAAVESGQCPQAPGDRSESTALGDACSPSGDTLLVGVRFVPDMDDGDASAASHDAAARPPESGSAREPGSEVASTSTSLSAHDGVGSMLQPHRPPRANVPLIDAESGEGSRTASQSEGADTQQVAPAQHAVHALALGGPPSSLERRARLPALQHACLGGLSPIAAPPGSKRQDCGPAETCQEL